ncbi:MAG TPA: DcaP family trimeric outer membrane transporter [Longimicrobium sp.]|nr:DcaP family trimeric outer membrane transporter [Longimicrobium sp.]
MKRTIVTAIACGLAGLTGSVAAQEEPKTTFEVYGHVMLDMGHDFGQVDPLWYDVVRPTRLPSFEDEFAPSGNMYFGVRQTRFGVRSSTPTSAGPVKTHFEFELFGTGADAGQTTFRLRHAFGELGRFGAGQTWSVFMDADVFPNSLEYWGPNGMVFFRNIQVRYMAVHGASRYAVALERPGASGDGGVYADRIELDDIRPHFPLPDLSAEGRLGGKWGYVELAGMLRYISWEDVGSDTFDLEGDAMGWGVNLSSNLKLGKNDVVRLQGVYGEAIQNYMNDAPADIGIASNPGGAPESPVTGEALPILGLVGFVDHTWSKRFSTSLGYSRIDIENSDLQDPSAFKSGQYALLNLLYYPIDNVMMGIEGQWGQRENHSDGFSSDDWRLQLGFKYNFKHQWGGNDK